MTTISKIEWTEATWNPVVGCTKLSAGCKHCYAEVMSRRLKAMAVPGYEHGFRTVRTLASRLDEPLARRKPPVYFVNSMSDLFHTKVPASFIDRVFETMEIADWHTFQVLTKRAERLAEFARDRELPANVWVGVSVENRRHGVPRIDHLRTVNAKVRFLSVEPLLEDLGQLDLSGIHWVIVGGESGPGARPMHPDWVRNVRRAGEEQRTSFFFKQWGAYAADGLRRSKQAHGRLLDGATWDSMPATA